MTRRNFFAFLTALLAGFLPRRRPRVVNKAVYRYAREGPLVDCSQSKEIARQLGEWAKTGKALAISTKGGKWHLHWPDGVA